MKKLFIFLSWFFLAISLKAQIKDANYVIDFSEALICNMDEESFAVYETDWFKDKPEIVGIFLEEILKKTGKLLPFRKSSENTVRVIVRKVTDNGKYRCDMELVDNKNSRLIDIKDVNCSKGGTWGTKLNLMKEGAHKEGSNLGSAMKSAFKTYLKQQTPISMK